MIGKLRMIKSAYRAGKETLKGSYGVYRTLTYPIRAPYSLAMWGLEKTWGGIKWTWNTGCYTGRVGKEAVMGAGTVVGRSAIDLAMAPVDFVKTNLVENFRTGIKGTLKLPGTILNTPFRTAGALRESAGEVLGETRNAVSHLLHLRPIECVKSTRNAIWSTLKSPFSIAKKTFSPLLEMPVEMTNNVYKAFKSYPNRLKKVPENVREGVTRILNARETARYQAAATAPSA